MTDNDPQLENSTAEEPAPDGLKPKYRGLGTRLFLAFAVVATLTVLASGVAWFSFDNFEKALDTTAGKSIPEVKLALQIAADGSALAASAPSLLASQDDDEREVYLEALVERADVMHAELKELSAITGDIEQVSLLDAKIDELVEKMQALSDAVEIRIEAAFQREAAATLANSIHTDLLAILVPMIDDANFEIVIGSEDALTGDTAAIEMLMGPGLTRLRVLMEIQSEANYLAGQLTAGATALDPTLIQPIRERFTASQARVQESLAQLEGVEGFEKLSEQLDSLIGIVDSEYSVFDVRIDELRSISNAQEILKDTQTTTNILIELSSELVKLADSDVAGSTSEASTAIETGRMWLIALTACSLITVLTIGFFYVNRRIVRRLVRLADAMSKIAGGKLQTDIPADGRDEITKMAKTLVVFRNGLAEVEEINARAEAERSASAKRRKSDMLNLADSFEGSVSGVVESVSTAASQLEAAARLMTEAAEKADGQARAAADATSGATDNVEVAASSARTLSDSIGQIGTKVSESLDISRAAVEQANTTNNEVEALAEDAGKIGDVVNLISDIAEQTNLLALNATIEAARAGEAGKGFAVVASEVKNLANQTAKATEEIEQQISSMQNRTQSAVEAIKMIGDTIAQVDGIATEIASAVEQQSASTQAIAENVEQAAHGAGEVSSNVNGVTETAGQAGQSAKEVLQAASGLSDQSAALRSEVENFLERVRAA